MTPQEQAIAAFEDTPVLVIAKLTGKAPGTIKAQRRIPKVRGVGVLTKRQALILADLSKGKRLKAIAAGLGISHATVKNHKYEIVLRLGREEYFKRTTPAPGGDITGAARAAAPPGNCIP